MKIELLQNAFRSITRQEEVTMAALAMVPRKRRELPVAGHHFDTVNEVSGVDKAVLLMFAAERFDPRRLSRLDAEALLELLHDGELLSKEDNRYLQVHLRTNTEKNSTIDLVAFFQSMLPPSAAKDAGLDLLDTIIGLRFSEAG